ncbi:MAG: diaminopimelate epimerase [Ferruginibacter sp.]|nr:diaminopimelate epimerase [Cytophagales bacterium]
MRFHKYQGTGNDFVMVDNRDEAFPVRTELVARLCHRRFGIGADGLILLQNHPHCDFRMVYFNADGNEGSMCGNGGRCLVQFAHQLGLVGGKVTFLASDGEHEAFLRDGLVHLKMADVGAVEGDGEVDFLDTGSPHCVVYRNDLRAFDVPGEGRKIRYDERFAPGGTNVNFVERLPDGQLFVRTYERGVEDETFSCGTGVTAAALSAGRRGGGSPVRIQTLGGELQVSFRQTGPQQFTDVYLIGPARKVFEGELPVGLQGVVPPG